MSPVRTVPTRRQTRRPGPGCQRRPRRTRARCGSAAYRPSRGESLSRKPLARPAGRPVSTRRDRRSSGLAPGCRAAGLGGSPRWRDAIQVGHPNVHEHNVGSMGPDHVDGSPPGDASATTSRSGWVPEHRRKPDPDQFLIVGDQHAHRHRGLTPEPEPGCGLAPGSPDQPVRTRPGRRRA